MPMLLASLALLAVQNPVIRAADPHAHVHDGRVWVYPTHSTRGRDDFYAWHSRDFAAWTRVGPVLDLADVAWARDGGRQGLGAWAPCVAERAGKWYFYFSVGPQSDEHPARLGVAVGDAPGGPFADSGKPLLTGGNALGFEAIDPMVYRDSRDGTYYLYAGGSAGATLRVFVLADDMVSFAREVDVEQPPHFTEGAFVHEREGTYHLTYSHGKWFDASYEVHHATAESPVGPWRYRGVILKSDDRHKGPGHHSVVRAASGKWYVVYHRWNARRGDGPFRGERVTCVDELVHGADGAIEPVRMTDKGPPADGFAGE